MKVSQLVKILRSGSKEEIKAVIENRKEVNQTKLRFLASVEDHGCKIEEDNMGLSTWYYITRGGELLASQFYWNEGSYNAEGVHSLYDEYGYAI